MTAALHLITFDNEVFRAYVFWLCVLCLKMMLMAALTAYHRVATNTYANLEDAALHNLKTVTFGNARVERVRRAHRNDLENILPLLLVAFVYLLTDPVPWVAVWLLHISGVARILHTLVYAVWIVAQPARIVCYTVPCFITTYMIAHTIAVVW